MKRKKEIRLDFVLTAGNMLNSAIKSYLTEGNVDSVIFNKAIEKEELVELMDKFSKKEDYLKFMADLNVATGLTVFNLEDEIFTDLRFCVNNTFKGNSFLVVEGKEELLTDVFEGVVYSENGSYTVLDDSSVTIKTCKNNNIGAIGIYKETACKLLDAISVEYFILNYLSEAIGVLSDELIKEVQDTLLECLKE